jgi:hypothetical protein
MSDEEFVRAFHEGALPNAAFGHRDHVRLAWLLTRRLGPAAGGEAVAEGIRRFAALHGNPGKYHETMTRFWARVVGHHVALRPEIVDFEAFVAAFPLLLDKSLPYRHWRAETLEGAEARARWVEPDLVGMPG